MSLRYTVIITQKGRIPMDTEKRRLEIGKILENAVDPLSASSLAERFSVSRQVIVGDIALLRAMGYEIASTSRGYQMQKKDFPYIGTLIACHTPTDMEDELLTIVDFGGTCLDVSVEHPVYGKLTGALNIASRYEVSCFMAHIQENASSPLSLLSKGVHRHRIGCPSKDVFILICDALKEKGYIKN